MLDTIELTLHEDADRRHNPRFVRLVRSKISAWHASATRGCTLIEMDTGKYHLVTQSYEMVTHLLTSNESEDADHGTLDSIIDPRD